MNVALILLKLISIFISIVTNKSNCFDFWLLAYSQKSWNSQNYIEAQYGSKEVQHCSKRREHIWRKKNATFQKMQILLPFLVLINLAQALVKIPPLKYSALDDRLLLSVPSSSPSSTQAFLSNRVFQNAQKSKDLRGWLAKYVVKHN